MKEFLKKWLPKEWVDFLNNSKKSAEGFLLRWVSRNKLLSGFYFLFVSSYSNEQLAVLRGRKAYYDSLKDIGQTCALLRRNIHRLEKGLIMRPRRDVFAESFILETVDCYKDAVRSTRLSWDERKWATDVLEEYFAVVASNRVIDQAKTIYDEAKQYINIDVDAQARWPGRSLKFKPYMYNKLPSSPISFDEIKHLYIRRRSVRWYQDRAVPFDLVQKAANIASLAPSACNRQPYRFAFCNNKERAVAIAKCAGGTTGFAENLPAIIMIVGDLSAYPYERDRHLIYIDGSLAAMQLMLALETLGLSTCSINWPEVDASERKIRKLVNLRDYERVVMLLAVGYADTDGGIPYSQKKVNDLILENIS